MKTETKYLIPEGNLDFENRINSFGDTTSDEMTFSYIFTMVGEELLQQKVYNYNSKYQNNENINGNLSNDNNFNQYQRDRLSSVASTIDDTGSDDFFINNDGEHSFRPRAQSSSDTEQDCYIIDQIFSKDNDEDDGDNDDEDDENDDDDDDDLDCNNISKFKNYSPNKNLNDDLNYKSIHLELDKVHIPFEANSPDDNKRKENNFIQIVNEDLLKVYDSDEKSSNVSEMILTLFDNVNEIKDDKVNEIKNFEQNKNYSQCNSQNIKTLNNNQTYNIKTEKNENFIEQNNQTEYFTKWFTDEISSLKQSTSELLMIDCDESVSSLTISEDSSYTNNVHNNCNNGFKGFKTYLSTPTCVNNNNNPLPPIETMLRQGMRGASFNSMIRRNSSSLHFKPKPYDNENGEFGHLNCRQAWQKSTTVNDMNCNISDNQVVVSQSEGAVVDMLPRVKEDVTSGLLECRWEDCWALFQGQPALVRHIEKTHVELRRGEDFACLWQACPRRTRPFNARYKLLIHMRVHSGEKPNKCPFQGCLKAFSRLENLKIHQRSHTGERPYACQFQGCPKAFSNSSDRAKHQRTHFDTKPYACQVVGCSKRYTDPSSLRKHIKNHGGLSTGRTKKLVASEPIVSPNELKARHYENATSLPSSAVPESSPKVELKNEPEISNEVPTITDLSDAMNEYIPYESVHHLLDEDCIDPSGWEEEMSAEIEREFLSLTSDYNASLMDVNEDNDNGENDYR